MRVSEDLNREIADNLLHSSLVCGDAGLLEGRHLLANENNEHELGAAREVVASLDTNERIGALVFLELRNDVGNAALAGTAQDNLLARVVILENSPITKTAIYTHTRAHTYKDNQTIQSLLLKALGWGNTAQHKNQRRAKCLPAGYWAKNIGTEDKSDNSWTSNEEMDTL